MSGAARAAEALRELDEVTRRLRRECPWDREQNERSIVPHTVEEAYELADAAHSGDDAKLLDELGDVLFQVYFLALLLEERGAGDLGGVAEHCRQKLIRRHPHVFGRSGAAGGGEGMSSLRAAAAADAEPDDRFAAIGDLMLSAVALARELKVDPELALRAAADAFRQREEETGSTRE